jgi:hypothetical protein
LPKQLIFCLLCVIALGGCRGQRGKSSPGRWVDDPSGGVKNDGTISFPKLGVKFDMPDPLYVYRNCGEASHSPDGPGRWIPVITCGSSGASASGSEEGDDPFADEPADEGGAEPIQMTIYVTKKTRPIDERAITWFETEYKRAGFSVSELSFQHSYQNKSGIYAKLHVMDSSTDTPTREIQQFMFPRGDVVFIARTEYPFGDTRSIDKDWEYILWNFNLVAVGEGKKEKK